MLSRYTLTAGLVGAVLAGGLLAAVPGVGAASLAPHSFATNQQQLEQQLASRVSQLGRLASDVTGSKTLSTAHAAALNASSVAQPPVEAS